MVEGLAHKRGIAITFPPFDSPCLVHADRTRLKQVLINLLSNAIKYNRDQGTVEVHSAGISEGRVRISITDTGAGLPAEMLEQLFQPFNRLGQETSDEEGTGIGLVVAKQLIELMEGSIGVESTVGVGSVFWFELKAGVDPQLAVTALGASPPVLRVGRNSAPMRTVLYVEDNPANLLLVERLLARRSDLRLLTAVNGTLGLDLARAHRPQVILMDINLPDISGIDALLLLRKDPTTAHIPVVAVSANAMQHDIERGMRAGFFRYLTKPLKVLEFMDTLNAALESADQGSGAAIKAAPLT